MRHLGQRRAPPRTGGSARPLASSWPCLAALLALVASGCLVDAAPARAADVTIKGIAEKGFGRIELAFDRTTKVRIGNNGTVLVIGFAEASRVRVEKLVDELPGYVAASRRDPDGTGIRLALSRPFRVSQLEAGERVFLDLLPERWTGLPPGLPPQVVAELAERARVAEEKLKAENSRRLAPVQPVSMRLGQTSERTRFVFEPPPGTRMSFEDRDDVTELRLEGRLTLDRAGNRPKAAQGVTDFEVGESETALTIRITGKPGHALRSFLDDGTAVVELLAPAPPTPPVATTPTPPARAVPAEAPRKEVERAEASPARASPASAPIAQAPRETTARPDPAPPPAEPPAQPPVAAERPGSVRPVAAKDEEGAGLVIPFRRPTPAAAFERGSRTIVVFQTADVIEMAGLADELREAIGLRDMRQQGGFAVLTFDQRPGQPLRLLPEGRGWRLASGTSAIPPDDVLVTRAGGQDGRGEVKVELAGTAVHWLLDPDDVPLAVVTTVGRQGLANPRRYVEFQLQPTIQGVVVQPNADGVQVALARGAVVVSRKSGLALSTVGQAGGVNDRHPFVIRSDEWESETGGDVMSRYRGLLQAAAEAPRAGKPAIRFNLARLFLANGMAIEAMSVLGAAAADDPLFGRRRETLLMAGIAAARARRPKEARAFLSDESLGADPEAALWRAGLDAEAGEWDKALAGLRRAEPVLIRYPDEIAGAFRLATVRGSVATGDVKSAEDALATIDRLPPGSVDRDEVDFLRAGVDEAAGRVAPALATFERLSEGASRPTAAAATLRAVQLGRRTAKLPVGDAVTRLETLAVSWRGDETELGTLAELVKLYGETKRWRELLATARLAYFRFPQREETRRIHDEASAKFEALFLGREGDGMDAVQYLALYYDFKEFAPVGRRGDEIVRRISDRLVEIDLLDQAATLLQHQVDHRLTGIARATIATRLAALRLMSGKPGLALSTLIASRMAELPAPLRRLRLIIEAQAQADLHRVELALEAVEGEEGADFARLRASIHFGARRWREAGEAFEQLLGTRWQDADALTEEERRDVIRAMLADTLAQEWMGLERLRSKFAAKMADSPDAKLFETLSRPRAVQSAEFRAALREASRADTLRRFLSDWSRVSALPDEPPPPPSKAATAKPRTGPG